MVRCAQISTAGVVTRPRILLTCPARRVLPFSPRSSCPSLSTALCLHAPPSGLATLSSPAALVRRCLWRGTPLRCRRNKRYFLSLLYARAFRRSMARSPGHQVSRRFFGRRSVASFRFMLIITLRPQVPGFAFSHPTAALRLPCRPLNPRRPGCRARAREASHGPCAVRAHPARAIQRSLSLHVAGRGTSTGGCVVVIAASLARPRTLAQY
ncbi:hypothetical protein OH77DRAFT_859107 [Trametes cingulata]|nr:hypothetical protein OH77DRAFT_859107 [Trametes cingulata]